MKKWKLALAGLLCAAMALTGTSSVQAGTLEEESRLPGGQVLWETVTVENGIDMYHRIPAIATANDGRLIAVTDKRYHNKNDLGNHQIDLVIKTSEDDGINWSEVTNLTQGLSTPTEGYGDAAIVADRESDRVLIICVGGSAGYFGSNPNNRNKFYSFWSEDGGKNFTGPVDMTEDIYGLDESWYGMFAGSGRIMQSRYIKVGEYYRIYTGISSRGSTRDSVNHVMYSDDFGETWHILGSTTVENAPIKPGDEPKVEELPNGDVVLVARRDQGRYVNIFRYDQGDDTYTQGSWGEIQGSFTMGASRGCNGETYFVYAKHKASGRYTYLALQTVPLVEYRKQLGIFYKELTAADEDPAKYAEGWTTENFFMVQPGEGGYATFSIQRDGNLAFFYEEGNPYYDMVYVPISLTDITEGEYEMAFPRGFGSRTNPYQVSSQEQVNALMDTYIRDEVRWKFVDEQCAAWIKEAMTAKMQAAQELYDTGALGAEHPVAVALQEKITAAETLKDSEEATAGALVDACREMVKAMDAYEDGDQLAEDLAAKLAEAEAVYADGELAETQEAAAALKAAIDEAKNDGTDVSNAEVYRMLTALTEGMEEYEGVVTLSGQLEDKKAEAETLLESDRLADGRKEVVLLQEIIAEAEESVYKESSPRLQEILGLLEDRMGYYEQAEVEDVTVESRYSSVHIRINALADVTSYKIYRSEQEESGYQELETIEVTDAQTFYSYIDRTAGTGKHHWYKIEGITEAGTDPVVYGPMQDLYATGIEAVQKHAEAEQYHADFLAENNYAFGGDRMEEASAEELAKAAALGEGTILISFKPADVNGRKTLFVIKQDSVGVGSGNLTAKTGYAIYQEDNGVRVDASNALLSTWKNTLTAGQWTTFGLVHTDFKNAGNNILSSINGRASTTYGRADMNGFFAQSPNLGSMTVGAGKNSNGPAVFFNGEIAYVTVTDEIFDQSELDAYGTALAALISSNLPAPGKVSGLQAEAEEQTVNLSWQALSGNVIGYEVSMDGEDWVEADSSTGHSFTGLESGREYTFYVRAFNTLVKGEAETVTIMLEGEAPEVPEQVAAPVFTPAAGTYTEAQQVEIASATAEAVIHYTTDGTDPTEESPVYTGAVTVDQDMVIKAIAVKEGMTDSASVSAAYTIQIPEPVKETVKTPAISPDGGSFTKAQTVTISCETEGASIYYTLDGSQPTAESQQYTDEFTISSSQTVKAIAVKEGMNDSETAAASFTIQKEENSWSFDDVKKDGSWKHKAVDFVYNEGMMGAITGTNSFFPDEPLQRAMLATILHRWQGTPAPTIANPFVDLNKNKYYYNAIIWAKEKGIVSGMGGTNVFAPESEVTREQIAKMLYEYGEKVLGLKLEASGNLNEFTDTKEVAGWAVNYMKWATGNGIITGKPNDAAKTSFRLDPKANATRAECAAMIQRFADKYVK